MPSGTVTPDITANTISQYNDDTTTTATTDFDETTQTMTTTELAATTTTTTESMTTDFPGPDQTTLVTDPWDDSLNNTIDIDNNKEDITEERNDDDEPPPTLFSDIFITGDDDPMSSRLGDGIDVTDDVIDNHHHHQPAAAAAAALTTDPADLDSTLSDLLADVDLDSLEQIMGELLPEAASSIASELKTDKGDDTTDMDDYLEYELVEEDDTNANQPPEELEPMLEAMAAAEQQYFGNSVNACPVKEEVWAPYWANNTKGQTLALMNIYPFEQYVHMEVCKFEHKQMLCKKGCKCEQQYGLHRLLAYDPNNECRGIFSDWFKFPSLCICKCYNHPENWYEELMDDDSETEKVDVESQDSSGQKEYSAEVQASTRTTKVLRFPEFNGAKVNIRNIPAFLPYEAKQALLKEIQDRNHRGLNLQQQEQAAGDQLVSGSADEPADKPDVVGSNMERRVKANYPQVEPPREVVQQQHTRSQHFLYGQMPIMDYKLADGSSGSVKQVPRK